MRITIWLAAAALASLAAGEARAQANFDPLCSVKTTSLDQRIAVCTRFCGR